MSRELEVGYEFTKAQIAELESLRKENSRLREALQIARPFINAWPQCRDAELIVIDKALKGM